MCTTARFVMSVYEYTIDSHMPMTIMDTLCFWVTSLNLLQLCGC